MAFGEPCKKKIWHLESGFWSINLGTAHQQYLAKVSDWSNKWKLLRVLETAYYKVLSPNIAEGAFCDQEISENCV